jgi:hypothetical protein
MNDGGTTSGGETLDRTHKNQILNPNGVVATDYKGSRDVGRPLDAPLLGSDMIHDPKAKIWCHSTGIGNIISVSFQRIQECTDLMSYAT